MAIQDSSVESNRVSIAGEWFRLPYWLPSAPLSRAAGWTCAANGNGAAETACRLAPFCGID
jgi:hypothetical protein